MSQSGHHSDIFLPLPKPLSLHHFICSICLDVLRNPHQGSPNDPHTFCLGCLSQVKHCPECKLPVTLPLLPCNKIKQIIGDLVVKCPDCKWTGEFGLEGKLFESHQAKCDGVEEVKLLTKSQKKNIRKRHNKIKDDKPVLLQKFPDDFTRKLINSSLNGDMEMVSITQILLDVYDESNRDFLLKNYLNQVKNNWSQEDRHFLIIHLMNLLIPKPKLEVLYFLCQCIDMDDYTIPEDWPLIELFKNLNRFTRFCPTTIFRRIYRRLNFKWSELLTKNNIHKQIHSQVSVRDPYFSWNLIRSICDVLKYSYVDDNVHFFWCSTWSELKTLDLFLFVIPQIYNAMCENKSEIFESINNVIFGVFKPQESFSSFTDFTNVLLDYIKDPRCYPCHDVNLLILRLCLKDEDFNKLICEKFSLILKNHLGFNEQPPSLSNLKMISFYQESISKLTILARGSQKDFWKKMNLHLDSIRYCELNSSVVAK